MFEVTSSDQDLETKLSKRHAFKSIYREQKLNLALRTNPCEFWRMIQFCHSKQSCFARGEVSSTDKYSFFKRLLNLDVTGDNANNVLENIVHDVNNNELNMPISDSEMIECV